MKGLLYKTTSWWNDDFPSLDGSSYYCVERESGKVHVVQSFSGYNDERVELLGSCDGSCTLFVELSQSVQDVVEGRTVEVCDGYSIPAENPTPTFYENDETVEESLQESLAQKMMAKVNRWSTRYRWTRQRRLVADFS